VSGAGPLDGLRVLEVSSFIAAPLGGMTLAQLGAEVIRVDPVGGGPDLGRWPLAASGTSLYWTALNKGKRSVTLNLREAEGRRLFGELLAASGPGGGVVLTNATGQGWLAYSELVRIRPDLIHLQVQGHRDGRAAVDYTVNAATGFPLITGPEGFEGPVNHVVALTRRHFADLAAVTGLVGPLAGLERLLGADFGEDGDRYRHREVIAALLAPWFAGRRCADVERELAGTSVLWSRYRSFTDLVGDGTLAGNPLLREISQPGVGLLLAPGSPLAVDARGRRVYEPATAPIAWSMRSASGIAPSAAVQTSTATPDLIFKIKYQK
jgi:crotonobetainyl-CoA:carnitine CoA-transferase CaiB-like acyl-CoA transferase